MTESATIVEIKEDTKTVDMNELVEYLEARKEQVFFGGDLHSSDVSGIGYASKCLLAQYATDVYNVDGVYTATTFIEEQVMGEPNRKIVAISDEVYKLIENLDRYVGFTSRGLRINMTGQEILDYIKG